MSGFAGKTFAVTGACGGIGAAVWQGLHALGARLILIDREAAAWPTELPAGVRCIAADLAGTDISVVLDAKIPSDVRIDGLVNIAGIQRMGAMLEAPVEDFDATFAVNVRGSYIMTQWIARRMVPTGAGSIVTVSSTSGRMPRVNQGFYCASKAALTQMMRVFGLELARHGIRVNTIAPGSTDTEMVRRMAGSMGFGSEVLTGSNASFRLGIPLNRVAEPEDIANAVKFLLSDEARHITMHELIVDGGGTLGL